jgi:hypothetical protein
LGGYLDDNSRGDARLVLLGASMFGLRFPETPAAWAVEIVVSITAAATILTFVELLIHKYLMHVRKFPKSWYKKLPWLDIAQRDHHVLHHCTYYKEFDYEPDDEGRELNLRIGWAERFGIAGCSIPFLIPIAYFISPILAASWLFVGLCHTLTWNLVHRQMHIPREDAIFKNWAIFRFLARHHFMHHVHPLRNYNVVLPGADFVVGTAIKPELKDVREMLRIGYLLPRSERGRQALEHTRQRVLERRRSESTEGARQAAQAVHTAHAVAA